MAYLVQRDIDAQLIEPGVPMPTVPLAAAAIGATEDQIIKTLVFVDERGGVLVAIARGSTRVDRAKLSEIAGAAKLKMADAKTVLAATGFPAGGVAPVGHATKLRVFIDQRVMSQQHVYGGGGTEDALLRIRPVDIVALTDAEIASFVTETP